MPKSKLDPWHFARPELAQRYLQTFQIGLISAQALFAPRRMGKSEFLEQDLIPAAQKSGLLTVYLNLWDAREHALDDTLVHVFNDSGYRTTWGRLLPADKAVLRALAQGVSDLHSLPARKRLGEEERNSGLRYSKDRRGRPGTPLLGAARR